MKENELPYYGVGPYYCGSIIILTIVTILLSYLNIIPKYSVPGLELIFNMLGIVLIIGAIALWIGGALKSDISGAYAYVRNPIYSAFLFLATGMIVFYGNIILFLLPILYWALLTELMKRTEEKWLEEKFGDEYRKYCKEVNRCIPWFK